MGVRQLDSAHRCNAWNHIAGWPSRPWGQCTTVAKPASLAPLLQIGLDQSSIDRMLDTMFHINDCACPHLRSTAWEPDPHHPHRASMLQKRAQCRPLVEAAFVSMLMYYKERKENEEMLDINISLEKVVRDNVGMRDAHDVVVPWGSLIHTEFVRNNDHLLTTSSSDSVDKELVQCIKAMACTIGQQGAQLVKQTEQITQMNHAQTSMVTVLLLLQQSMQESQKFALHCFTTPGLATTVTPSVGSPCPHTPASQGAVPVLWVPCVYTYVCAPTTRHSSCMCSYTPAPPSHACTPSTCTRNMLPSPTIHDTPHVPASSPSKSIPAPPDCPVATMPTQDDIGQSASNSGVYQYTACILDRMLLYIH